MLVDGTVVAISLQRVAPGPANRTIRLRLVSDRSAALIEARSNVGPIVFGTSSLTGWLEARFEGGVLLADPTPRAEVTLELRSLTSGIPLYDAELVRRLDAHRYPVSLTVQREMVPTGVDSGYRLSGQVSLHGVTRPISGTVSVRPGSDGGLVVSGEQVFDMRDFHISSPAVLMFRMFPDVRVQVDLTFA